MLSQTILLSTLAALLPCTLAASAWSFSTFSNKDIGSCVEPVDNFAPAGNGNTGCFFDAINPPDRIEARAFIGTQAEDGCTVTLYSERDCGAESAIGRFDGTGLWQCEATAGGAEIVAWQVTGCSA